LGVVCCELRRMMRAEKGGSLLQDSSRSREHPTRQTQLALTENWTFWRINQFPGRSSPAAGTSAKLRQSTTTYGSSYQK